MYLYIMYPYVLLQHMQTDTWVDIGVNTACMCVCVPARVFGSEIQCSAICKHQLSTNAIQRVVEPLSATGLASYLPGIVK